MFDMFRKKRGNWKDDILSGLTVSLALVPEAIAFALIAGLSPLVGLYAAFFVGLITAAFGGRPGMISGATGALAVVMVSLVKAGEVRGGEGAGLEYLLATVVLMGLLQVGAGALKLGKLIRLVPHPVMMGFVNGLAIVIFLSQLDMFRVREDGTTGDWLQGPAMMTMVALTALTMAIIILLPKLTRAVPASLVAILAVTGIVAFGLNTQVVGDLGSVKGGLPMFHLPTIPLNWDTFAFIFPFALVLAAIGLIESLMTLQLIDVMTETRGKGNRECVAQGAANIVTGFFGGMGGCAMIGQSLINIKSGGRGRTSGIVAALALLCFILFGSPFIDKIPIAALTGVMFMVVIGTFEWATFRTFGKVPKSDLLVIGIVTGVTVMVDLAAAVLVGVIVSALVFAWKSSQHVHIKTVSNDGNERVYALSGLLYFGSVTDFSQHFRPAKDPDSVVVDFLDARVCDMSGLEAINTLSERYRKVGKTLHVRHLSRDCRQMLIRAGALVDVEVREDDPAYLVAQIGHVAAKERGHLPDDNDDLPGDVLPTRT
ncbi:MAG: SulP family inorganic anion transporter [Candidatus Sumerlaeia bacterium]|nr:SulP family inorganic anion transporter [Candidatus Sumerlaeia bacterium]